MNNIYVGEVSKRGKDSKDIKKLKEWLFKTSEKILEHFLIDSIDVHFSFNHNHKLENAIFTIQHKREYHSAHIRVYEAGIKAFKDGDMELLTRGLVHELSHIHTIPLAELALDRHSGESEIREAAEELTDILSKYIIRTISPNNKDLYKKLK